MSEHQINQQELEALRRREAEILGRPPRVAAPAPHEDPADRRQLSDELLLATGAELRDANVTSDQITTLMRHADLFRAHAAVGLLLLSKGELVPRDRELAILRTGWLCQAPFEWGEHVKIAKRIGLTSNEIERITQGSQASGWSAHESAILKTVEELHEKAMVSDATWHVLAQQLSDKQLIELLIVIGQYHTVAFYQNAMRLRLNPDNRGLFTR